MGADAVPYFERRELLVIRREIGLEWARLFLGATGVAEPCRAGLAIRALQPALFGADRDGKFASATSASVWDSAIITSVMLAWRSAMKPSTPPFDQSIRTNKPGD
jgi:hypothetical protein